MSDPLRAHLEAALARTHVVIDELGRGGMGVVYRAWEHALEREVAIKVLPPAFAHVPEAAARFLREARIVARLAHPNIVVVHGAGQHAGLCWFAMQLVDGIALDDFLAFRGALAEDEARWLLLQATRALVHAHAAGVVHRDLKPGNLLLATDGTLVVTDFGIARAEALPNVTGSGAIVGTPAYMSPEQVLGRPVTPASDQYALGVVAWQLLAGRLPFEGDAFSMQVGHVREAPPSLASQRAGIAPSLVAAIHRMLAKEPAARWPSLDALVPLFAEGLALDGGDARRRIARDVQARRGDGAGGAVRTPRSWSPPPGWRPDLASDAPRHATPRRGEFGAFARQVVARLVTPKHRTPAAVAQEAVARARAQRDAVQREAARRDAERPVLPPPSPRAASPVAVTRAATAATARTTRATARVESPTMRAVPSAPGASRAARTTLAGGAATLLLAGIVWYVASPTTTLTDDAPATAASTTTDMGASTAASGPSSMSPSQSPSPTGTAPTTVPTTIAPATTASPTNDLTPTITTTREPLRTSTAKPVVTTPAPDDAAPPRREPAVVVVRPPIVDDGTRTPPPDDTPPSTPAPTPPPARGAAPETGAVRSAVAAWVASVAPGTGAVRDFYAEGVGHSLRAGEVREVGRDGDGVDVEFDLLLDRRNAIGVAQPRRVTVRARAVRRGDGASLDGVQIGALVRR